MSVKNHRQQHHLLDCSHPFPGFFFFFPPLSQVRASSLSAMEELLKHLTEVSIRPATIVEHLATRQGRTEQELAALHATAAPRVPQPDAPGTSNQAASRNDPS